jgi:hypothetical protein
LEKWKVGVGDKHIFKGGQINIKELYKISSEGKFWSSIGNFWS